MPATSSEIAEFQRLYNRFVKDRKLGYRILRVDGRGGPRTREAIRVFRKMAGFINWRHSRYLLGAEGSFALLPIVRAPAAKIKGHSERAHRARIRRAKSRQHRRRLDLERHAVPSGLSYFEGRACAAWIAGWLKRSRRWGWTSPATSLYRTPEYSDSLCRRICGAARCPGLCAGRSSNHSGLIFPRGAADVLGWLTFASIQRRIGSPLRNALPRDRVHQSVSGV